MQKSLKEIAIENKISEMLTGKAALAASIALDDEEIQALQDYANVVSIKRLGFNDHGPVHMRTAALNALIMFELLTLARVKFNLEKERIGGVEESKIAVLLACLLHDIGMSVSRDNHEIFGVQMAIPIVNRILSEVYPNEVKKNTVIRSLIIEGISGHMAKHDIHSLEAGLVLIGDGCDMAKGRARIPFLLTRSPHVGDIHKYSAHSIQKVQIIKGEENPVRIIVEMSESVGFFQIEEVLFPKIVSNPVKPYIELYGTVNGGNLKRYL